MDPLTAAAPPISSSGRLPVRLVVAVALAVAVHGALLLVGTWKGTYDANVHLFFADHYDRDWFSTWDTRWYTGFTTTSYPPGAHMLLAALGRVVGLPLSYVPVQLGAIVLVVVGTHRSARIWVGEGGAGWAAILVALSPSLAEVVHVFGQLPTTLGLGFTLNALPSAHRWVLLGGRRNLATALAASAAATAAHHVTTLFGAVFFVGPVVVAALLAALRQPLPGEVAGHPRHLDRTQLAAVVARRLRRLLRPLLRAAAYGSLLLAVLLTVVLPYWLWSHADPIVQIPIPHASRADFLERLDAGLVFWLVPWGATLLLLPVALWRGLRSRTWPLAASVLLLFVLGLGGTTPVARLLTRGAFDILTFDRFTIWATVAVLPLVGEVVHRLTDEHGRRALRRDLGRPIAVALLGAMAAAQLAGFLFAASLTQHRPFQPDEIDPDPIVEFLAKDDHDLWRYLALGFGDQMAWVSSRTTATTVDGNYHSARRLPELTTRPVERLEGAKYRGLPGLASLQQFLTIPERWNLKYVFSNDAFYDPLLFSSGWQHVGRLQNGIEVWERPDVPPLPEVLPVRELPVAHRLLWGLLPPAALVAAFVTLAWQAVRPARPGTPRHLPVVSRAEAALARTASRVRGPLEKRDWHLRGRREGSLRRGPRRGVRMVAACVALLLPVAAGVVVLTTASGPRTAEDVVVDWYVALDERRWQDAHDLLDPATRPDLESWLVGQSIDGGGLVDSYAELDAVEVEVVERTAGRLVARAHARWVTSVSRHEATVDHVLVDADGHWALLPTPRDPSIAVESLARRAGVSYVEGERRSVTTGRTSFSDVQDRPEVDVRSARLLEVDGRHVVVGEIANVDVDPAYVTLTAILRGPGGEELARWNAQRHTQHTVLPGSSTPFRIEFEGIAGSRATQDLLTGGFDPDEWTPPTLPQDAVVTSFDLYAKALVTATTLERPLGTQGTSIAVEGGRLRVDGTLRNVSTLEASVPRVLVALHDTDGVAWVDSVLVSEAVRPQQAHDVALALDLPDHVRVVDPTGRVFDNGLEVEGATSPPAATSHPVAGRPDLRATVHVDAFVRSVR